MMKLATYTLLGGLAVFPVQQAAAEKKTESDWTQVKANNTTHFSYEQTSHQRTYFSQSRITNTAHSAAFNRFYNNNQLDPDSINKIVRSMSQRLMEDFVNIDTYAPLAVASFVMLDGEFNQTDIVGKQLSESFLHEIYRAGVPVVDYKIMDFIRVTEQGDYVMSRDYLELKADLPIEYVLAGTITKHRNGHLVNARIVGLKSKQVKASAQGILPKEVTASIMGVGFKDGVMVY